MNKRKNSVTTFSTIILVAFILCLCFDTLAQNREPFIRLGGALKEQNTVNSSRQFITGITCADCTMRINETPVKVYSTGTFAYEAVLSAGENEYVLEAARGTRKVVRKVTFTFLPPHPARPLNNAGIESIKIYPEGNLQLMAGDQVSFEVRAFPNSLVTAMGKVLHEMPAGRDSTLMGIYRGSYVVQPVDTFAYKFVPVKLVSAAGDTLLKNAATGISVLSPFASTIVRTKGRLAHLEFGLGDDRLGGAKIGYLDSLIPLEVTGKIGKDYRIRLAPGRTAYIEDDLVELMPVGVSLRPSLTGKWTVSGGTGADYVKVALERRLPYQSMQFTDPSRIVVDVFGAVNNTNWITQLQSAKEIESVDYEQTGDEVFRINIKLKHAQHWGHSIYYEGNQLVIRVRHQPQSLLLKDLVIAVDAGHGGRNTGAAGLTGAVEKDLTLDVSLRLQKLLEKEGARVIMTRTTERFFDNKERILFYRDSLPDLLISFHLNSSADPINVGGTAVFYRYPGFRKLSSHIQKRMMELGLGDYGTNGSFNFMLNSPTEYPNALVEALFLSNLAEEELVLDPDFRERMAGKIVEGIKDFLAAVKNDE